MSQEHRREVTLEEALNDPIVQLLMKRDGVTADDVRAVVEQVKARLENGGNNAEGGDGPEG
ncbi:MULTISPECIES: hypothetical protein [Hyphomicrobiales]|uniref:Uncharacterized protein n=1 Tax=Pseudochelatococcus contaminans TaxID=1538103 RepID=A0A7W5Z6R3_9HYPH|nr:MULTISPECIES: hypothetical protein [Hyphomicrobiales]MBB3810870.1 hypothetical protein [Pseudochelatococcus contaminans]WGG58366.1 hypothetical protein QA414_08385 [Brucella intermedia]